MLMAVTIKHIHSKLILTHWGRVTHICVSNLTITGPDNGLSPGRRQAVIWTNAGILLIGPLGTNFSEILIEINTFSFKKMRLKMSSAKWRPFRLGLNELNTNLTKSHSSRAFISVTKIILKISTGNGSDTAVLCAKFQNNLTTEQYVMGKRGSMRFEFKIFPRLTYSWTGSSSVSSSFLSVSPYSSSSSSSTLEHTKI